MTVLLIPTPVFTVGIPLMLLGFSLYMANPTERVAFAKARKAFNEGFDRMVKKGK